MYNLPKIIPTIKPWGTLSKRQVRALPKIYRSEMEKMQKTYGLLLPPTIPTGYLFSQRSAETEFDERYHPKAIVELLSYGLSLTAAAGYLGITLRKLVTWRSKYQIFDDACEHGLDLALGWWEELGRRNLMNRVFNTKLYQLYMTNNFGWASSDKVDLKQDINLEVTSTFSGATLDLTNLTDDQLAELDRRTAERKSRAGDVIYPN